MTHWMIDIETLDVTADAVILSAAAVPFDIEQENSLTELMDAGHYFVLATQPQLDAGRTVSASTLAWHLDGEVREDMLRDYFHGDRRPLHPDIFTHNFGQLFNEKDYLWANAPSFDLSILRSYYKQFGVIFPVPFYREMCYRTIKASTHRQLEAKNSALAHNALYDAAYQARQLQRMLDAA